MNCHNSERYLSEAIDSVINQKYKNWELIFWDNKSNDNSPNIVNSYKDKRINYFLSERFTTLGTARNLALKKAKGEFIAFLDCDDLWMPSKLDLQIPLFNDPDVGIVISNTIFFNKKGGEKKLYSKFKPPTGYVFKQIIESYFISLETAVIRKTALDNIEWFDERFEVIEEFDLFARLAINFKLAYIDETLGKWRIHQESDTWNKQHLFPAEKKIFIEKMVKEYPKLTKDYKKSFKKLSCEIKIEEFIFDWSKNKKANTKIISKIIGSSKKALILYLLSKFIPYSLFKYLKNKKDLLI